MMKRKITLLLAGVALTLAALQAAAAQSVQVGPLPYPNEILPIPRYGSPPGLAGGIQAWNDAAVKPWQDYQMRPVQFYGFGVRDPLTTHRIMWVRTTGAQPPGQAQRTGLMRREWRAQQSSGAPAPGPMPAAGFVPIRIK